jgi:cobalt-zinc-cadmium efflux system membrane fusion protein
VVISVSDAGVGMAGIRLATAQKRRLGNTVLLPGEIGFNEDRLAHITPRYSGVVKEVLGDLGEFVEENAELAVIESNQSLTTYVIRAPFSGHIIEKHAIPGEYLSEETSIYVIADLSSVWVDLDVYPRHMESVSVGSIVTIKAISMDRKAEGSVSYVAPLFDLAKRAAIARVVLPNSDLWWRPGMFVSAELEIASHDSVLCVEKDAIQVVDGQTQVFVSEGPHSFRPVRVVLGTSGKEFVEILSGLLPGDSYVAQGAFQLKAEMITSSLGAHAGHGH